MVSEDFGGLESLQVLLQQNPNSLTFGRVAEALLKLGRSDEAIQICEDGLRRHPGYVTGHMVLGKCYLKKKLFDQAEKEFKRVLLFDPKYLAAHKHYGDLMREIGWDNTCEMSYRKILHIDPLDKGVRAVIEELAQRGKTEKPESAPIRPESKPAVEPPPLPIPVPPPLPKPVVSVPSVIPPVPQDDFFSTVDTGDNDLLRYQPAMAADDLAFADFTSPVSAPPVSVTPPPPEEDEERVAYILDDIFQDEVLDEKPAAPPPAAKTPMPPANKPALFPPEARSDNQTSVPEKIKFPETPEVRRETNQAAWRDDDIDQPFDDHTDGVAPPRLLGGAPKIPTRPIDFDLDEAPPADKNSGFDFDMPKLEEPQTPARPNQNLPPAAPTRLPARRPRILEDRGHEEPASHPLGEREKIVTPTLGEIYAAQGQYTKAIGVFELLSKKEPNNRHYREKIDYLKKRLQETQNAG